MTGPTHVTFAEFLYLLLLTTTGVSLNPLNAAVIALSSLLPDVDTAASTAGKLMPFISLRIERRFGHRTITHALISIAFLAAAALPLTLVNRDLYVCFMTGYASHPFLDTMTVNGVKLFYPFSPAKCVFPLEVNNPHRYRVRIGGKMDRALGLIFLLGCVPTFIVSYQGYERFIRATQQNIEAAVRDYGELSRDHTVFASITAYSMLTKQPLEGRVEVVGALNPHTLVFRGPDRMLHTMGKDFQADFVVRTILCDPGGPARYRIQHVDVGGWLLAEVISSLDTSAENFLFGDLTTGDRVSLPENIRVFTPVSGSAGTIRFNFASCEDIRACNLEGVLVTKGVLTIKTILANGSGEPDSGSGIHSRPESYSRVVSLIDPKDSLLLLKRPGDTLRETEIIARVDRARFFIEQQALLEQKLSAARERSQDLIVDFQHRISDAEQAVKVDSEECRQSEELLRNGFISPELFRVSQLKWLRNRRTASELVSSNDAAAARSALEIATLVLAIKETGAKASAAERESEIRSPVHGLLADIRRLSRDRKMEVVFIIKRLP
jgi:inner membrane protein